LVNFATLPSRRWKARFSKSLAGVQNPVAPIRHEIDAPARHVLLKQDVDGRDKPGHDEL
jgi:hypothetical protein